MHPGRARLERHQPEDTGTATEVEHHVFRADELVDRSPVPGEFHRVGQVLVVQERVFHGRIMPAGGIIGP